MTLAAQAASQNIVSLLVPWVIMIAVFYFLLIRPQQQQQKKRKALLEAVSKGDRVITIGGIHGEVTALKDDTVLLRIAEKVEVKVSRSAINHVKGKE